MDTKKVGGDGGGRCWNSLLGGEWGSNPFARETSKVEKGNPEAPAAAAAHVFWRVGGHGAGG